MVSILKYEIFSQGKNLNVGKIIKNSKTRCSRFW